MISVQEALAKVLEHRVSCETEEVNLLQSAGRILAKDVTADRDFPPFDRVTMDGFALQTKTFQHGITSFPIEGIQPAGHTQLALQNSANCLEVMTGAVLPAHTDAVIPYELCSVSKGVATVNTPTVTQYQNVHRQGTDCKAGAILLKAGIQITPAVVGIMASVGFENVPVLRLPKIAICSTGDELVEVSAQPLPHQIRRSNVYVLAIALQAVGITAQTFHLPDSPEELYRQLSTLELEFDAILLSGAVSKGKFDYLPSVLEKLEMQKIFHGIAQKPGKPFLFGSMPNGAKIFGFPGNPVSSFVCYHLYFRPWLKASLGNKEITVTAKLTKDINFPPALTNHQLVTLHPHEGSLLATPIGGSGSGDLTSLIEAQGILSLPADKEIFRAGEVYELTLLDGKLGF